MTHHAEQQHLTLSMVCTMQLPALMFVLLRDVGRSGRAYTYGLPLQKHTDTHNRLVLNLVTLDVSPWRMLLCNSGV
jgi:hypothetical protein